jgi:hypothetical protein
VPSPSISEMDHHLPLPLAGEGRGEGKPLSGDARPEGPRDAKPLKLAFALFALLVGGCSMSKWTVKPHQRELLADRIMQLDADAQERSAEEHVLANREGAIGGTGTSGGGCGCN